ncbi:MAG: DUF262 domain-containing protein [Meiothermus sp.]|nr:DUF262 domain-containing protein [Meiothermus sp.]
MNVGEIQPSAQKIDKIVNRIREGDTKIPAFQRGFVWNQEQIIELLDSINKNYPIGSILLWNTHERLKSSRNIGGLVLPEREPTYPVNYVLDGQQRLSSIYAVFTLDRTLDAETMGISDPSVFDISFDLIEEAFVPTQDVEDDHPSISLSSLLDTRAFINSLKPIDQNLWVIAENLLSRINNYEIPVVTISKRSKDEVGTIFERINSTGTTLTPLDLLVAWTWSEDFHLREAIADLSDVLDEKSFGELPDKIILQCLGAVLSKDARTKTIVTLSATLVRDQFANVGSAISAAIDFLSTEFRIQSILLLPHLQQVVALSYFFSKAKTPSSGQLVGLRNWFWRTSFSRRYAAQTDDKINADILFMQKLIEGDNKGIEAYSSEITQDSLVKLKFVKSHPYTRALLLALAQKMPLNLTNGAKVDLGDALSGFNRKEYHHIFPQAFLKRQGFSTDKINSMCNFCFLPAGSNKQISNRAPSDYIFTLVPQSQLVEIFESNVLPTNLEIYSDDDFDAFLAERASLLSQLIRSLSAETTATS